MLGLHDRLAYSEESILRRYHDRPFVEWVNGQDSNYSEGQYVGAVFAGHMPENHIFSA